jgi:phosphoribosylformylglycinamidine cyclo-ligase
VENIPRVLPQGFGARIRKSAWPMPPLFGWLQQNGGVADAEMHRVFNCGIGMAVIVAETDAARATQLLSEAGEKVYRIGSIEPCAAGQPRTIVV